MQNTRGNPSYTSIVSLFELLIWKKGFELIIAVGNGDEDHNIRLKLPKGNGTSNNLIRISFDTDHSSPTENITSLSNLEKGWSLDYPH